MEERVLIEVDLDRREAVRRPLPEAWRRLGGRALTSAVVAEQVDPRCHPLSAANLLVIAPGLLAGTGLSSANRLSAGAKSPLTGGIKESNCGGVAGYKLGRLGVAAVLLRGRLRGGPLPAGLRIGREGVSFLDLSELAGRPIYESAERLLARYGRKAGLILAGPAGEIRLAAACLSVNDPEGEPCRNLGRGGLGAVLGAKGLKAIVIEEEGGQVPVADREKLKEAIRRFAACLREHPVTGEKFARYGTCMTLLTVNGLGGLPTRNFREGVFEGAEAIGAESLYQTIRGRGGRWAHGCMPGCVIRCSNKYVDPRGEPVVGSLDYETICLLGSNLGLSDLDQIASLNRLCNEVGVDTMETGVALGVLAEGGLFRFGDYGAARGLIEEIGRGSPLGRLLGSGAAACARAYGVERVPVVKGQGMAAYDPRAIKGMGLTYAFSPMGADHTAGNAITLSVDHLDPEAQLEPVRRLHARTMVLDWLGLCLFTGRVSLAQPRLIEEMLEAVRGWKVGFEELEALGWQMLGREREFNRRAGFAEAADRLPGFMLAEKLPPGGPVFDIREEVQARFYDPWKPAGGN